MSLDFVNVWHFLVTGGAKPIHTTMAEMSYQAIATANTFIHLTSSTWLFEGCSIFAKYAFSQAMLTIMKLYISFQ